MISGSPLYFIPCKHYFISTGLSTQHRGFRFFGKPFLPVNATGSTIYCCYHSCLQYQHHYKTNGYFIPEFKKFLQKYPSYSLQADINAPLSPAPFGSMVWNGPLSRRAPGIAVGEHFSCYRKLLRNVPVIQKAGSVKDICFHICRLLNVIYLIFIFFTEL